MDITHKSAVLLEIKANVPAREVEGYAATYDPDDVGDIIMPGAFKRTLEARHLTAIRDKGRSDIRILWQHEKEKPIGVLIDAREDERGLYVKFRISRTTLGDDALQLLADGAIDRMSIGYIVRDYGQASLVGTPMRTLKDIDLWEISLVTFPANTAAIVSGVKSAAGSPNLEFRAQMFKLEKGSDEMNLELKAGKVLATRNIERLKNIYKQCEQMMDHCKAMLREVGCDMDEKAAPSRSEDAGGRGLPPSNHTAERDARKADVPPVGEATPEPDSIASLIGSLGEAEPEPDSVAAYPGPFPTPTPEPESIAASPGTSGGYDPSAPADDGLLPAVGLPAEMSDDASPAEHLAELERIANGGTRTPIQELADLLSRNQPAPNSQPSGSGPFPVQAPAPQSIASSQDSNTSSDNAISNLVAEAKAMRLRLSKL